MSDLFKSKTAIIKLPSLGIPYNSEALIERDSIRVKNYLMDDHRESSSAAASLSLYNYFKLILDRFIVEPAAASLPLNKFLMSDILAILYTIKAASWGPDFTIHGFKCKACGQDKSPLLNMGNFNVLYADEIEDYKATGIELAVGGRTISCHLPTLGDEQDVLKGLADLRKTKGIKNPFLDENLMRLAQVIDTIDGQSHPLLIKFESLLKISVEECERVSSVLVDKDTGILLEEFKVLCPVCEVDNSDEVDLGYNPHFFRAPDNDGPAGGPKSEIKHSRKLHIQRHSFANAASVDGAVQESDQNS